MWFLEQEIFLYSEQYNRHIKLLIIKNKILLLCLKYLTNGEHSMVHHPISFFLKRFFVPRTWSVCCDQISDFFLKIWCCMGFCYLPGVVIWQHIHPSSFTWINPLWAFFLLSRKYTPFRCERCWQSPLCPPTYVRWS